LQGQLYGKTLVNNNGLAKLTGLTASSFYEYQYRPYIAGNWGDWYPSSLYFSTPAETISTPVANVPVKEIKQHY
jgi:hypothetical protein